MQPRRRGRRPSRLAALAPQGDGPSKPSDRSGLVFQLVDELGHALDLDAGLALSRLGSLDDFEPRLDIDAVVGGRLLVDRLLLAFMMLGSEA